MRLARIGLFALATLLAPRLEAQRPLKVFVSVDMEGISGIGTGAMTNANGKDYQLGRRLMTDEVNAVVAAIFQRSATAQVLVNDSHGDMQNLLHTELDPRVQYIQGAVKPVGMVAGLDSSFDAVIFLGYHARAGTANGFLAHTGTGSVKGLWINGMEVGEGELNALYAGAFGVPVILAAGDSLAVEQIAKATGAEVVTTKYAVTPQSARLIHPQVVRERLAAATGRALGRIDTPAAKPMRLTTNSVRVRLQLADVTTPQILEAIPGVKQIDGYTVEFNAPSMAAAYKLIRLMYRFVTV
ncbi:MAG TPA: M55 family metallopeptidase [Gemmatimonadaceae bacterium]